MDTKKYLQKLKDQLIAKENWRKIVLTREWARKTSKNAGVYVFREKDKIIYVGETGCLKKRMTDLLDSRNHSLRRNLGDRYYSKSPGYIKATTSNTFPENIENLVNKHICKKLEFAFLEVSLGRKELEEFIESELEVKSKLNKKGKRK